MIILWRCFIRRPPVQDDHFWVVPRVVVLYRFDCNWSFFWFSFVFWNVTNISTASLIQVLTLPGFEIRNCKLQFAINFEYVTVNFFLIFLKSANQFLMDHRSIYILSCKAKGLFSPQCLFTWRSIIKCFYTSCLNTFNVATFREILLPFQKVRSVFWNTVPLNTFVHDVKNLLYLELNSQTKLFLRK